jgi:hypothetical protein
VIPEEQLTEPDVALNAVEPPAPTVGAVPVVENVLPVNATQSLFELSLHFARAHK